MKLAFALIALSIFLASCGSNTISYNHAKIIKKHKEGFKIILNSENINPEFYFLDKDNIRVITLNKKLKLVQISQNDSLSKFAKTTGIVENAKNGRTNNPKQIDFTVIDGIPYPKEDFEKIQIEPKSIKNITIVSNDSVFPTACKAIGAYLLIQTKQ